MARGTFGNIRLRNMLVPDSEGDWTIYHPESKMRIREASENYKSNNTPLIVIAGKNTNRSSRDWAMKGQIYWVLKL